MATTNSTTHPTPDQLCDEVLENVADGRAMILNSRAREAAETARELMPYLAELKRRGLGMPELEIDACRFVIKPDEGDGANN